MKEVINELQLFYSMDGSNWESSVTGCKWSDEKCSGYLYKHLTWHEFQSIVNPPKSQEEINAELAVIENEWVKSEMQYADYQVNLHIDDDERKTLTQGDWSSYRRELRDYVKDGKVTSQDRPQRPVS